LPGETGFGPGKSGIFKKKINRFFDKLEIPGTVSIQKMKVADCCDPSLERDYIVFEASETGYFFFIKNLRLMPYMQAEGLEDSPFSNDVNDIKLLIVETFIKYMPVPINPGTIVPGAGTGGYEVPCDIYDWLLGNVYDIDFEELHAFKESVENLYNYIQECYKKYMSLTEIRETDDYKGFVQIIKDTVTGTMFDNEIFAGFDLENLLKLLEAIEEITSEIYNAQHKFREQYWLHERCDWRIPMMKYPNGAFKGTTIVPDFPGGEG